MKLRLRLGLLLIYIILTVSCSGGRIGYVVMLWPPDNVNAKSGEIISVISQSDIRNVYVVEKKSDKYRAEIPRYTGRFFKKKKDAQEYLLKYSDFKDMYGFSDKSIPVRETPDTLSPRIYKLRPSQVVKIIDREEEVVTVGNLTGQWYRVLTEDGYEGFCFDEYLKFFELDSEKTSEDEGKDWIEELFSNRWYPSRYREVVESGRIVISSLKTGEGLFLDRDKKLFVIQTEDDRIEFYYDNITKISDRRYFFEGTTIEINFYPNKSINIKYVYKGIDYSGFYTRLDKTIDEYVSEEISRRNSMYSELTGRGGYLSSNLYGSIVLKKDRKFIWTGYVNLVPDIIPSGYGISGKVENQYYLSDGLSGQYNGILTFIFEKSSKEVSFVYYMTDEEGIELIYLPPEYIEEGLVEKLPDEKEIYYFRQAVSLEDSQVF